MRLHFFSLILLAIATANAQAQTAPTIINPETGSGVNLTRAYWNANIDIANRRLTCEWYIQANGQIQLQSALTYDHNPLPASTPSVNSAQVYRNGLPVDRGWGLYDPSRAWGVSDGIYIGPMPLHLSPFVEEIAHNSDSINAVRIWDDNYGSFICFDGSGQPLLPTGSAGTGNTNLVELEDFTFEFPEAPSADTVIPELYSLSTGEKIELVRGLWNYSDIANHLVSCGARGWDGENYTGQPDSAVSVYFPYNSGESVAVSSRGQDIQNWLIDDMAIANITLPPPRFSYRFMELTDTGYRMWGDRNQEFYECSIRSVTGITGVSNFETEPDQISPVTVLPPVEGGCDYSDSDQYNGWGWNAVTRTSCPPLTTVEDNCDYTGASLNAGWGWDAVVQESCPPLVTPPPTSGGCDYTSAATQGGWGWNPNTLQSCPPVSTPLTCEDTDGDGYGWNGVSTCDPSD